MIALNFLAGYELRRSHRVRSPSKTLTGQVALPPAAEGAEHEEWRPIPGYEGLYEVSNYGLVKSLGNGRTRKTKLIGSFIQSRCRQSYFTVCLCVNYRTAFFQSVGSLVLSAFVPKPISHLEACHNNGQGLDDRLSNLRWDTRRSNALDMPRRYRRPRRQHPHARLSPFVVRAIRKDPRRQVDIASDYGITQTAVSAIKCCIRYRWID